LAVCSQRRLAWIDLVEHCRWSGRRHHANQTVHQASQVTARAGETIDVHRQIKQATESLRR
jgi:hypothetical protein